MKKGSDFPSPFIKNGRFFNSENEPPKKFFFKTMAMVAHSFFKRSRRKNPSPQNWVQSSSILERSIEPTITWIGHATFLIQVGGFNILTDPIFGRPSFLFPRIFEPGISVDKLPPIDVVLISHNHWDHMHGPSLKTLHGHFKQQATQILVPDGDHLWFASHDFHHVTPHQWGRSQTISRSFMDHDGISHTQHLTCTFLPAYHWSRRGLFDYNASLWGSWMIEYEGKTIYFAGDTAYGDHFVHIAQQFPSIDIALLPIGPCEPNEAMKHSHMNAEEAGQAFMDLNAQHFIPMHWGTFYFGVDAFEAPLHRITTWWQQNHALIKDAKLHTPKLGERVSIEVLGQVRTPRVANYHHEHIIG